MELIHIILPILLGALIGYCTNYIAIKMLFHPKKEVYIGKWKLPFTPSNPKESIENCKGSRKYYQRTAIYSIGFNGEIKKQQCKKLICQQDC